MIGGILLAPVHMIRDIRERGGFLGFWGPALNIPQVVGGLIFITHPAGWLTLVLNVVTVTIAGNIHKHSPYSRLTSLCHILWLPLVPYLYTVWQDTEKTSLFGLWLAYTLITMIICLWLDGVNLWKYFTGNSEDL